MKSSDVLCFSRQLLRSRRRRLLRTWRNVRVTLLCGLLTLVVLRSYLGAGKLGSPLQDYQDIRDHLHSFKLRHVQLNLFLRSSDQLTEKAVSLLKDAPRSTLSLPDLQESYRRGRIPSHLDTAFRMPGSSPAITPRPRILLVSASHSCRDAIEAQFFLRMQKNKMDYCRLHGIEVFSDIVEAHSTLPPLSRLLHELMLSHPQVEWIWWMDSLAIFTNMLSHVAFERYAGYNAVVYAGNGVHAPKDRNMAMAWDRMWDGGSFLMRNCESSRAFLAGAGRRMGSMEVYTERTEEGAGEAWPLVMHLGRRCGLCGKGNTTMSCVTAAESALNHAERSQRKLLQVG